MKFKYFCSRFFFTCTDHMISKPWTFPKCLQCIDAKFESESVLLHVWWFVSRSVEAGSRSFGLGLQNFLSRVLGQYSTRSVTEQACAS